MQIGDLQKKQLICFKKDDSIKTIAKAMKNHNIGGVVIVSDDGEPLGFLTDRDIVIRCLANNGNLDEKAGNIMTSNCVVIKYYASVDEALQLMGRMQIRRVILIDDDNKALGIVSLGDLALFKKAHYKIGKTLKNISMISTQKTKIQDALRVDDYPL